MISRAFVDSLFTASFVLQFIEVIQIFGKNLTAAVFYTVIKSALIKTIYSSRQKLPVNIFLFIQDRLDPMLNYSRKLPSVRAISSVLPVTNMPRLCTILP